MFGSSGLQILSAALPTRASTRTALAVAALAAGCFAIAGPAHAQSCVGGYRMLKDEIPVICQQDHASRAMLSPAGGSATEPFHTGSINRTEMPANAARPANSPTTASSNTDATCVNGMRYVATPANGATLMMKCS